MKLSKRTVIAAMALCFTALSSPSHALDNPTLSKLFGDFDSALESYATKLVASDWAGAETEAKAIEAQAKHMMELAATDSNPNWLYDVTNLYHHTSELVEATVGKEAVEGVFLTGILAAHIGYVQSANPVWLREEVGKNIEIIEAAIKSKDQRTARDAAEVVHSSSNKIVLSSGTMKHLYKNTRWLNDVRQMNGWGDAIIGEMNSNNWEGPASKLVDIKAAYEAWSSAFK